MKKRMSNMQVELRTHKLIVQLAALDSESNDVRRKLDEHMTLPMGKVIERIPGATLREKAKALGLSHNTLWYWAKGRRPPRKHAERLAKITGYSVRQIINE